jgi:hypothetical protein
MTGRPKRSRTAADAFGRLAAMQLNEIRFGGRDRGGDLFIARVGEQDHQPAAATDTGRQREACRVRFLGENRDKRLSPAKSAPARIAASAASALVIPQILTWMLMGRRLWPRGAANASNAGLLA